MPDPIVVDAVTDAPPAVPPPSGRKSTASERADEALAMLADLNRWRETFDPTFSTTGALRLTDTQAAALAKVPALDGDIEALANALNEIAERVNVTARDGNDASVAAYEKLRDDIQATLTEIRGTGGVSTDDAARAGVSDLTRHLTELVARVDRIGEKIAGLNAEQNEHDQDIVSLRERIAALEGRPSLTVDQRTVVRKQSAGLARPAVLRLMRKVVEIGKDSQAPASAGGFKFRGIEAVMDAIGTAMRADDVGLVMETKILDRDVNRTESGGRMWTSVVMTIRYTFVHPDDGSEHSFEMVGEGRDMGDKAASKAASMAAKYGLCQALMIPFTNMADSDAEDPATQQAQEREAYQARQEQQARSEERRGGTSDQAHLDSDPWADAPHADAAPPRPTPATNPGERAAAAVAALDTLAQLPLEDARTKWSAIKAGVLEEQLGGVIVNGSNVTLHLEMHRAMLAPGGSRARG